MMDIRTHCVFLVRYALYSGAAVLCEIAVFVLFFRRFSLPPFWANALSAVAGLALAWFLSGRRIFAEKTITLSGHVTWYGYQCIAIGVYSHLVAWLISVGMHYLLGKIAVLALSFTVNSLFFRAVILKPRRGKMP
jgi:putative flippase GtrA